MKKRLKRVEPFQLGKILGALYTLGSLVMVPFFLLFSVLASLAPQADPSAPALPLMLGMGFGFILIAPVMYGGMGFISGIIGAFLYNMVAKWLGGIEVEVE